MANESLPNSPFSNEKSNSTFTPARLRRLEGDGRARRFSLQEENSTRVENVTRVNLSSIATAALIALGLAAVEAVRIGLVHEVLGGFFAGGAGVLPFAPALTLGLAALDAGLLVRLFLPWTSWRDMAAWAAIGAWLLATTANSILVMYAVAGAIDAAHQLADIAPAAVAIVLLVLRLLLIGALAWDSKTVIGNRS